MLTRRCNLRSSAHAALIATALTLGACRSLGPESEPPPSVDRASLLTSQGDNAGAARVYEALAAQNTGTDQADMLLRSMRAYLAAHQIDQAARVAAEVHPPVTPAQSFDLQLLNIELTLARGQSEDAWRQVAAVHVPADPTAALHYLELRRRIAFGSSRPLEGVRAEIEEERYLTPEQRHGARAELLAQLRDASEHNVKIDPSAAPDAITRGWLELAPLSAQAARVPGSAAAALEAWRVRHPSHPAQEVVRGELLGVPSAPALPQPQLALLLPLTSRQASAAASVRDGFLTAYYVNAAAQRPRIRIYDTAQMSISEAVTRATQDGAEFIVGPLTRDEITAAADLTARRPPMLALNFLPPEHAAPAAFYQFALSPEDEAREAARRILAEGYRRGVALVPQGAWGKRVLSSFKEELTAGGGTLVEDAMFDAARGNYSPAITDALGVNDSYARHKRLESVLGTKLQFQPRRRADIDFIFAPSSAAAARLLRPQLRYYFAGDVPTYATSDAFDPDPTANQDLEGLMFPDMPWMLGGGLADSVRTAARDAWPNGGPRRNRLFAFGFDAYRLAGVLRSEPAAPTLSLDGLTGHLTLDAQRRVHRELEWAQVHQGQPQVLRAPQAARASRSSGAIRAASGPASAPRVR